MSTLEPITKPDFFSAEQLLAAIVDSSEDAIVSKDLHSVVTSWNKSAERIFGYTAPEMVGQPILKVIPEDRRHEEASIIERLRRGERVDHFDTVRQRKDGTLIEVSLTISPVRNSAGLIVGASKIARDVSEAKRSARELEEVGAELRRQSRIKDEFLATLSHELRTPLQSILGWAQMLRSSPIDPEELRQGLEVIDRNAQAQQKIIEDLLDMNRILSGKLRLDVQQVLLLPVIEAAIDTVRPTALAKNIRLQAVLDPLARPSSGDPQRLHQIFWNLLSNAVKFTPSGGRVQVLLERVNSHVEITISDTGMGIAADFLPYVFDRFRQEDGKSTKRHGGLGLGLSIVKSLVELHGGSVSARSAGVNQGATFIICLPVTPVHPGEKAHPAAPREPAGSLKDWPDLSHLSVLVVDDEADTRQLVGRTLERAGATVRSAASAAEALQLLDEAIPDILVSDIGMPGRDGYDLIRSVRARPAGTGGQVPAIALTAYARVEDRIKAISSGFQMLLPKPADTFELLSMVAAYGGRKG